MQSTVYMFLAEEIIRKNFYSDYKIENISMNYYQPALDNKPITINYNEKLHEENKMKILNNINNIENTDFYNEDNINKNLNHCKYIFSSSIGSISFILLIHLLKFLSSIFPKGILEKYLSHNK